MQSFIYLWFDRKHNRFYIGSHHGMPDDGYICSSSWMKAAYRRRPQDFRRKIIEIVESRENLLAAEQKWLDLIKDEELGKRYYNLKKTANGGFSRNAGAASRAYRLGRPLTEEHKNKLSKALKDKPWTKARRKAQKGNYTRRLVYEFNGVVLGTIEEACKFSQKSKATINRYCDHNCKYGKTNWRKYYVPRLG